MIIEYDLGEFVDTGRCTPKPVRYVARYVRRRETAKWINEVIEEIERERELYVTDEDGTTYCLIGERS